jgi:hypothetical protein
MKKLLLLLFITFTVLSAKELDYESLLNKKAQSLLGSKYTSEFNKMSQSPSFPKFKELFEERSDKKINNNLTLKVFPYLALFKVLKSLDKESDSLLPAYHAFNLMFLSYGPNSKEINISHGEYFSKSLIRKEICEGYVWGGLMYERERETWEHAKSLFEKAAKICTDPSLKQRSAMSLSKLGYLISQKNKRMNK